MEHPKVSVLIPCYNAEKYIGETLDSVFRQTWSNIEIIIVDDGSQDRSIDIIERCKNERVRLIRQANAGAGAARNRAYKASSGAFIQFLDADDIIDPDKIERQMVRLTGRPHSVASAEWGRFRRSPNETQFDAEPVWRDLNPVDWLVLSRTDGFGMLFPALWLVPRQIVDAAGPWDEALSLGDDGEYFTRVLLLSDQVVFCPGARCRYRSGLIGSLSGRTTPQAWMSQFSVIQKCERYVRSREDSDRVRRGFALSWQHFAHSAYPYNGSIAEEALSRARGLYPLTIAPDGGSAFRMAARIFGWRLARRLQVASVRP